MRPRRDHPRGPDRAARHRRRHPGLGRPRGGAPVRGSGAGFGVRRDPGRIEPRRRGANHPDAGHRADRPDRPAGRPARARRLREPGAIPRGGLPVRVRAHGVGSRPMSTAASKALSTGVIRPSLRAQLMGIGSIFGKSLRDSRRTALVLLIVTVLLIVATTSQIVLQFDTATKRAAFALEMSRLPAIFEGMLGTPIGIDKLAGFLSWRVINFSPVILGIWSLTALSGILAGEVSRGSIDMLATGRIGRRRLALEKLAGYLAAAALYVLLAALGTYAAIAVFATLPGDNVGLGAVLAHHVWLFVTMLVPGSGAFAIAPIVGRGIALAAGGRHAFARFSVITHGSSFSALDKP